MSNNDFTLYKEDYSNDCVIPQINDIEFAQEFPRFISNAYDEYAGTTDFWRVELRRKGHGFFLVELPMRICVSCGEPIIRGHAWNLLHDKEGHLRWIDLDKKEKSFCCEQGRVYNERRSSYIKRHLAAVLESLLRSQGSPSGETMIFKKTRR